MSLAEDGVSGTDAAGVRSGGPAPTLLGRLVGSRWQQVAETSGARVYLVLVMLLSTSLTAHHLGPDGRGVLVVAQGWAAMFSTLGYLSMAQPLFRRVSGKPAEEWLPEALGTLLAIVGCVTLLGWAIAAGMFWATDGEIFKRLDVRVLIAAYAALPFMLWGENGNSIMLAMGKLRTLNILQVVAGTVSLMAVFVSVAFLHARVPGVLLAIMINPLIIAVAGVAFMLRHVSGVRVSWPAARRLLTEGAQLHLNAVGSVLASYVSILILNHYRPPAETAYLQLVGQMLVGLSIIPGAVGSVAYSNIGKLGADGAWPSQKRLLVQTLALMTVLSVVAWFAVPLVVRLLGGNEFLPSVRLFRLLLPTAILSTINGCTTSQWVARGLFRWLAAYGLILGVVTVAGMAFAVPRYGLDGAVWVSLFSSFVSLVLTCGTLVWIERQWRQSVRAA